MSSNQMFKQSLLSALGVAAYVTLIVTGLFKLMPGPDGESLFVPIAMLMLFVVSAAIVGSLVLLKPIMMYVSGMKAESVKLLLWTIGWLAGFTVIAFVVAKLF